MSRRTLLTPFVIALLALAGCETQPVAAPNQPVGSTDPYQWLEDVEGERALNQVRAWNTSTLQRLTEDPRFAQFERDALAVVNATDKIPYGAYRGGWVYNFWQDADSVRGQLRRARLEDYEQANTNWQVLLDIDALAAEEDANWVYKGSICLAPEYTRCLLRLSEGGKDAAEQREWDHEQGGFVENGFFVPTAKSRTTWEHTDSILVATDWGEGSLTESGYPYILKRWQRGTPLADAEELFRGEPTDVGAGAITLLRDDGSLIPFAYRQTSFYEVAYFWLSQDGPIALPIPRQASIQGLLSGQVILTLREDWSPPGEDVTFDSGSLVSFDLDEWMITRRLPTPTLLVPTDERSSIERVAVTQSRLLVVKLEEVVGKLYTFEFHDGHWAGRPLVLPGTATLGLISANKSSDTALITRSGFTEPTALAAVDVASGEHRIIKTTPDRFDAQGLVTEQFMATSTDGEQIPYFVVRHSSTQLDGNNPTLLYAYGGFQIAMKPSYSGIRGKLWLERGGVYVLANIRGGGEFGPRWHQAGLKTKRQLIFDDFIAVAEDLTERGITRPEKLGIMGGSNGGLLMGVMYNQRPDLWNAIVCQVPLLDMLRYHTLLAGASWVGEYGDPEIFEERAFLERISPYHNVRKDAEYPEIFFVTSTKDDRVHPGHARKMAARLEQLGHPFAYYENIDGGHSAAANLAETAKRTAMEYTFLHQQLVD